MTPEDLDQITAALDQRFTQRLDRAVESISTEISGLRAEMNDRFESVNRRIDRLAENVTGINTQLSAINQQFAGMSRWADSLDTDNQKIHESLHQHEQRIARLERDLHPDQH